ncbi:gamma-glutamylcyclotransferase [Paraburkholderia caledonica]|uniref:gamma-glutamylcyclotransferase n=1 Tax=Paraburkholderia caledonica TaxID=134536 RepID=UPI00211B3FF7|nr:gamma-glutamylcyclotransferase [Paraburkholderia caledonica]
MSSPIASGTATVLVTLERRGFACPIIVAGWDEGIPLFQKTLEQSGLWRIDVLSRKLILSGAYLQAFASALGDTLWPLERIEASLNQTLEKRPRNTDVWLFGYGSLLWNPLFEFDAREIATLHGWHRSFCLRVVAGRGSVEAPGRMLSLEPGGSTTGVALRLPKEKLVDELRIIWIREMVAGAYMPTWADVTLRDGRIVSALVFVANPSHPYHEANSDIAFIAPIISTASGDIGTNEEYVKRLQSSLADCEESDPYVDELAAELERLHASREH